MHLQSGLHLCKLELSRAHTLHAAVTIVALVASAARFLAKPSQFFAIIDDLVVIVARVSA